MNAERTQYNFFQKRFLHLVAEFTTASNRTFTFRVWVQFFTATTNPQHTIWNWRATPSDSRFSKIAPVEKYWNQIKILSCIILAGLRQSVYRVGKAHLRIIAPGQHSSFRRNVAEVASRWQHCVRFDRPKIWTSDLPLQRRTRYRSTNWTVLLKSTKKNNKKTYR